VEVADRALPKPINSSGIKNIQETIKDADSIKNMAGNMRRILL
jgi:hypothetical protein